MKYKWDFSCISDDAPTLMNPKYKHYKRLVTPYGKIKLSVDVNYDDVSKTVSYVSPYGVITDEPIQEYGYEVYSSLRSLVEHGVDISFLIFKENT